jgi:hypothetical protein
MTTNKDTIKFLEAIEHRGIVNCENISGYLIQIFNWDDYLKEDNKHLATEAQQFLTGLIEEGLVRIPDRNYSHLGEQREKGYLWLNELPISGRITTGGIAFLERERERDHNKKMNSSVLETNQSVRDTNTIQKWALGGTLFVTIIGSIFQGLTYKLEKSNRKKEVEALQDSIVLIQEQMRHLSNAPATGHGQTYSLFDSKKPSADTTKTPLKPNIDQ